MAESNDARTNSTQQLDQLDQLGKFMMIVVMNVGFPLLAFFLTYKYRESQKNETVSFGLRVLFENYRRKF